jgi:transposase
VQIAEEKKVPGKDEQIDQLNSLVSALRSELSETQAKLDYLIKKAFTPSSERRPPYVEQDGVQQTLFGQPVTQDATPEPSAITVPEHQRKVVKKGHGRTPVSIDLPLEEVIVPATEAEKVGPDGEPLALLGYEESDKVDIVPGKLRRLRIKREKWGLPDTRETLVTAAVPPCLIPKGKATDAFALEIILNKFHLGLPLHRQLMDLNHQGAQLSDSFLSDLVKQVAERFAPVWEALRKQVLSNRVVHADETPIRQLVPSLQPEEDLPDRRVRTSYFWAWLGGGQFYLHYATSRSQSEVRKVLGMNDEGEIDPGGLIAFLVTDGYAGYNPASESPPNGRARIRRVACWAHVRRRFIECADRGDTNAQQVLALINELFRVERRIRKDLDKQDLAGDAATAYRHAQRQRDSIGIVAAIKDLISRLAPLYTAGRDMAGNLAYTMRLWDALTLFLDHGDLPLDNNAAERSLRPVVVGRKNWYFVGSEDAGTWAAIFFSLIESCRMLKMDPRRYLTTVAKALIADTPPDPATLTPLALRDVIKVN